MIRSFMSSARLGFGVQSSRKKIGGVNLFSLRNVTSPRNNFLRHSTWSSGIERVMTSREAGVKDVCSKSAQIG